MCHPVVRHAALRTLPLLLAALAATGCAEDSPQGPSQPDPVQVTEDFAGTLTVNGAVAHVFPVQRAGGVSAQITELSIDGLTLGMSLGTWNGLACTLIIAAPSAREGDQLVGTAQTVGNFCVYLNDNGTLTESIDYSVRVTHF